MTTTDIISPDLNRAATAKRQITSVLATVNSHEYRLYWTGRHGTSDGGPVAGCGHQLFLHGVKPASQNLVDVGGIACASAADVTQQADVIILMLPDTPDVERVLLPPMVSSVDW